MTHLTTFLAGMLVGIALLVWWAWPERERT